MKIGIIGAGVFGTALGDILKTNNHEVNYYDPIIEQSNLTDVLERSELVIFAAPSEVSDDILANVPASMPLVIASKGFLSLDSFAKFENWMVLAGVGFADDIKAHKPTKFTITDNLLSELFTADYISFDFTDDRLGVLICGALKNVYAMIAGYNKLTKDSEAWKRFIVDASVEIRLILALNSADEETFSLACGLNDLELTCGFPSRNYEFGQTLAEGSDRTPNRTIEGISALSQIRDDVIDLPDSAVILKTFLKEVDGLK